MLRLILALALVVVVGAMGFWFWSQSTGAGTDTTRARTEPAASPEMPMATPPEVAPPTTVPEGAKVPQQQDSLPPAPGADRAAAAPLLQRKLSPPVSNLKASDVQDTFYQSRAAGERRHEASDIMAPRGTPVLAMDDGIITKLFTSKPGGLTIYQFDSSNQYCFYYAHLDRYAEGLAEGQFVRKGTTIGYVGSTGNADINAPHLHFAIYELGPEKKWWDEANKPINPHPVLSSIVRR
jgi:murein DD-endopeptidase MepM/ murein hydrolase activator NlpD